MQERKWTHNLGYENGVDLSARKEMDIPPEYKNGVSSGFKCKTGNGRTRWDTKME